MADPLAAMISPLADDEDVRAALKALALDTIGHAQELLEDGIPAIKMQVIRTVLPALTKALQHDDTKDMDDLKEKVGDMYGRIQEQLK